MRITISGEARLVGWSRQMLYSGFNISHRSVFWSADFNGRSDNLDVIPLVCMSDSSIDWSNFVCEGPWFGRLDVSWLGNNISTCIEAPDSGIADSQKAICEFVIGLPFSTRMALESHLYHEYQTNIIGSVCAGPNIELTPKIANSTEIWNLLHGTSIQIPPERNIDMERQFAVTFECLWDEEHGLSILFNADGLPTKFGVQGCFF